MLKIIDLAISANDKNIVCGFSFHFKKGKSYALLGPNGSGKSTLAKAIMADPQYRVSGKLIYKGRDIAQLKTEERAMAGIFLSFQQPAVLEGVPIYKLFYQVFSGKKDLATVKKEADALAATLGIKEELLRRPLNENFSGGEKKKFEALQAMMMKPQLMVFDEIDSGIDVDSLKKITKPLAESLGGERTMIFISHNPRLFKHITVNEYLVMQNGRLEKTGGEELLREIETKGFAYGK